MDTFSIYNKSSEKMPEISDSSVDLIVTSPPYNIGTQYGQNIDKLSLSDFQKLLGDVFSECYRVLKNDGKLIVEAADTIVTGETYFQLSGHIQSVCLTLGFKLEERHINFVRSENGIELPEHGWGADYTTTSEAHSNCHQLLVLSKSPHTIFNPVGKVLYINYSSTEGHPCPTPKEMLSFISEHYLKDGMTVLDSFMGTGALGGDVLKRNGVYLGYEIDQSVYTIAKEKLEGMKK